MKQKSALTVFLFFAFSVCSSAALPPNDDQCNPTVLLLGTPGSCPFSVGISTTQTGDNTFATSSPPQAALQGCMPSGNMANPMSDVWYAFQATSNVIDINISGAINTPQIALYMYWGDCLAIVPVGCAIGSGGTLSATFESIIPGTSYWLQVGGGNAGDVGTFNLVINSYNDCTKCLQNSFLQMYPAPVNGYYHPGDTVFFCYYVLGYKQLGTNWLHGIYPRFGAGWDLTSLQTFPGPSVSGTGNWGWFSGINTPLDGSVNGFFYNTSIPIDGNPQNNRGDDGNIYDVWAFCWQIKAKSTCVSQDLSIQIFNYSDSETGTVALPSSLCNGDPNYFFNAVMSCCPSPNLSGAGESCNGACDGQVTALGPPGDVPYNYSWYDDNGFLIQQNNNQFFTSMLDSLCEGTYSIIIETNSGCYSTQNFIIEGPVQFDLDQNYADCDNVSCLNQATVNLAIGLNPADFTYQWTPGTQTTQTATGLCPFTTYTVFVSDSTGTCVVSDTITIYPAPLDDATFTYPTANICIGGGDVYPNYIAMPGGIFTSLSAQLTVDSLSGMIDVSASLPGGPYTVQYITNGQCPDTFFVTVNITSIDDPYFSYPDSAFCPYEANQFPDSIATLGGTFTIAPPGLTINPATGLLSVFGATPGTYTITYTTPNPPPCQASSTFTVYINIVPPQPILNQTSFTYCQGDPMQPVIASGSGPIGWFSDPALTNLVFTGPSFTPPPGLPVGVTSYYVIASNPSLTCISIPPVQVDITINPLPNANAGADTAICEGFSMQLNASGGGTYAWSPATALSDPFIPNPVADPSATTTYIVTVTANGCQKKDTVTLTVEPISSCDTLIIYSGITPNGDIHNDEWIIEGILAFPENKVMIFNRWGDVVWETQDYNNRDKVWKGEYQGGGHVPDGTYFYVINIPDKEIYKGWIEVTR